MSANTVNILLVGKTGAGKSSTANTILGDKVFETKAGKSVTKTCYGKSKTIFGRKILVIDAPGFCDTDKLDTAEEIDKYLLHCVDGIHVVALVLSAANRPTQEEIDVIKALENKFGRDMLKFLVIIVTRADDLEADDMTVEDFVKAYEGEAKNILRECCRLGNVIGFDNRAKEKRDQQVKELLSKVELIQEHNQGRFYTRAMLEKKNKENKKIEEECQRKIQEEEEAKKRKEEEYEKAWKDLEEAKANEERNREAFEKTTKKMQEDMQLQKAEASRRQEQYDERRRKDKEEMRELQEKIRDEKDAVKRVLRQNEEQKQEYDRSHRNLLEEIEGQKKENERVREKAEESRRSDKIERKKLEKKMQEAMESERANTQKLRDTMQCQSDKFARDLNTAHKQMEEDRARHERQRDMENRTHQIQMAEMEAANKKHFKNEIENMTTQMKAEHQREMHEMTTSFNRQMQDMKDKIAEGGVLQDVLKIAGGVAAGLGAGLLTGNPIVGVATGATAATAVKTLTENK